MYDPSNAQNMMSMHSMMPGNQLSTAYSHIYSTPYAPLDRGHFRPSIWEMAGVAEPRNPAIDLVRRHAMQAEARRRYFSDVAFEVEKTAWSAGRYGSIGMGGLIGGIAGTFLGGPLGTMAGAAIGTGAGWTFSMGTIDAQRRLREKRYLESIRRSFSGQRGAGVLGMTGRDLFDTSLPQNMQQVMRGVAKDMDMSLEDVYEGAHGFYNSGVFRSSKDIKEFGKQFKELLESAKDMAKDLGVGVDEGIREMANYRARGFIDPSMGKRITNEIRRTVNATSYDPRYVAQMSQLGYQTALNYRMDPIIGSNISTKLTEKMGTYMNSAAYSGAYSDDMQSAFRRLGGEQNVIAGLTGMITEGFMKKGPSVQRAMMSLNERGEKINAVNLANEQLRLMRSPLQRDKNEEYSKNFISVLGQQLSGMDKDKQVAYASMYTGGDREYAKTLVQLANDPSAESRIGRYKTAAEYTKAISKELFDGDFAKAKDFLIQKYGYEEIRRMYNAKDFNKYLKTKVKEEDMFHNLKGSKKGRDFLGKMRDAGFDLTTKSKKELEAMSNFFSGKEQTFELEELRAMGLGSEDYNSNLIKMAEAGKVSYDSESGLIKAKGLNALAILGHSQEDISKLAGLKEGLGKHAGEIAGQLESDLGAEKKASQKSLMEMPFTQAMGEIAGALKTVLLEIFKNDESGGIAVNAVQ